tara:strand:- start:3439 stop:3555 length:117 start_codon:yes stop_codon:yes gene_type:complete
MNDSKMPDDFLGDDFSWPKVIVIGLAFLIAMFIIGISI